MGVATVSRVINGSTAVSEATRRRVLEVVAELGYEPNATARALSTGRTRAVGVIAPFFTRPSVIERLRGVPRCSPPPATSSSSSTSRPPSSRDAAFRSPIGRVDGLISISLAPSRRGPGPAARGRGAARARRPRPRPRCRRSSSTTSRAAGWPPRTCSSSGTPGSRSPATRSTRSHGASASYRRCVGYQRAMADAGAPARPELVRVRPHGADARGGPAGPARARPPADRDLRGLRPPGARRARGRADARPAGPRASCRWSASTTSSWPATRA